MRRITIKPSLTRSAAQPLAFLALAALASQPVLTQLHGVHDTIGALGRTAAVRGHGGVADQLAVAPDAAAIPHDGAACPLCLARIQSRAGALRSLVILVQPARSGCALAATALAPSARHVRGVPVPRGPPSLV